MSTTGFDRATQKFCSKCGQIKNRQTDFYHAGTKTMAYCKPCHSASRKAHYQVKGTRFDRLTNDQLEWIKDQKREGASYATIAAGIGFTSIQVRRWFQQGKITLDDESDEEKESE